MVRRGKQRGRNKYERIPIKHDIGMELETFIAYEGAPRDWRIWRKSNRGYQKIFKDVALEATGRKHHPHELRGLYCVDLLDQGVPLEVVSKMLGHSSTKTTLAYYVKITAGQKSTINQSVRA